jgi:hypothetical protein
LPIIIKIGRLAEICWAIIALIRFVLASSGIFNTYNGITYFADSVYTNAAAISHLSSGILLFVTGVGVVAAGYFGIRGKIIILRS